MAILLTGPIDRKFTLADGTVYDVAPAQIEVASPEHAAELAHLIGLHHEAVGHPGMVHEDGTVEPFVYTRPDTQEA